MNKREAGRVAHAIVYGLIQSALDSGIAPLEEAAVNGDGEKLETALDSIAQRHFILGKVGDKVSRSNQVTDFAITLLRKIMLDAAREDRWQTMHEIGSKLRKEYGLNCTPADIRAWLREVSGDNQHILAARRRVHPEQVHREREGAPIYEYLLFPRLRPMGAP